MEAASGFEPLNRGFADLRLSHLATPPHAAKILEREPGFEPATPTLARLCSTTELFPRPGEDCNKGPCSVSTYGPSGTSPRRYSAASSGGVGLMKKPVPHSKPATRVNFGMISRCQWKWSRSGLRSGALWSMKL